MALSEGVQPDQGLTAYLLGPVPARRYLRPWVRLYFKAARWGFRWFSHHETCFACGGEITTELGLPPLVERPNDFYQLCMCLSCGATGIAWWMSGERVAIAIEGSEWNEPSTAVLILKRVLEERAAMTRQGPTWDFLG